MKANDIQIGDWLYSLIDRYDHVEKKLCKVTGIRTDSDTPLIQCDDTDVWYHLDSYEPVHLIPEILEKNGFYYDEDRKAYLMGVIFRVKPERYGLFSFEICGCPYPLNTVHQLQHALRLCGIDKTIEL